VSIDIETIELVEPWLTGVLSTNTALMTLAGGVLVGTLAPVGNLRLPAVVFHYVSSRDVLTGTGDLVDTSSLYLVKFVAATSSWADVLPGAKLIHQLLQHVQHTFPGGGSLTCGREMIHQVPEEVAGQQYRHLGGVYRIRASKD